MDIDTFLKTDPWVSNNTQQENINKPTIQGRQPAQSSSSSLIDSVIREWEPTPTQPQVAPSVATQQPVTPKKPEESFTIEELQTSPELFKDISSYMKTRFNEPQKEGESNADYVNRFLGKMRFNDFNTAGGLSELNWIRNAKKEDAVIAAKAHDLYDRTANFYESGGASTVGAVTDAAKAIFLDPLSYVGFGIGAITKTTLARQGMKAGIAQALKSSAGVKALGIGAGTEAAIGAGQAVLGERIKQEADIAMDREVREISPLAVGLGAALGTLGGGLEVASVFRKGVTKTTAEELAEKTREAITSNPKLPSSVNAPLNKIETVVADELTNNMDNLVSQFMKIEGKDVLERIDPATGLTDAKIQKDISSAAVRVAAKVITDDPAFQLKEGQKVSDAIANVFKNLDQIDDVVLERAIRQAGLTPDEFAKANLTTVSEAAQIMQQYSAISKMFNRLAKMDPEFEKRAAELFGKQEATTSAFGYVGQLANRLERESKAWVVSGLGTTTRNILGTGVGLVFRSAASLLEGTLLTLTRNLQAASTGQSTNFIRDFGTTIKNSFNELSYLKNAGLSAEVTDTLLKHNPSIRNNLLSALQETGNQDVTRAARFFNTLNVAQDAYFRRAIFSASVEKKLGQMGMDMYQLIGENKTIPADILSSAVDDALKATFSYMPKPVKKDVATFEAGAETMAHHFVKVFENVPGGSLLVTFPRFMSNAMAFQYRYSVFGAASGASDMLNGALKNFKNAGSGDALVLKGMENLSKGVVGTAALYGAYKYRQENADTPWYAYTADDGSQTDLRSLFPIGPYLAVGEFLAKLKSGDPIKAGEMIQTIVGMKLPAGTQNTILDQIISSASSERDADKLNTNIGKILGDFTSRFTAPWAFKTATDFYDLFDREQSIARDPNVIAGDDKIMEAAVNRVKKNITGLRTDLPEAVQRLREETPVQEGAFFRGLLGVTAKAPQNFAEREVTRLGIDPYKLFGQSTGDKEYDRKFIEISNPYVLATIKRVTNNNRYKELSPPAQRIALTNSVQEILKTTRTITMSKFANEDLNRIFKIQFDKMTSDERKLINEAYAKEHDGVTLEENKDYKVVPLYKGMTLAPLQFAIGGLAKGITKAVGKLLDSEIDNIVTKSVSAAEQAGPDVLKQADELLSPAPVVQQTEQLLKKEATPIEATSPFQVVKGVKYNTEDVAAAEKEAVDFFKSSGMSDEAIAKGKADDPSWYEGQIREKLYEAGVDPYKPAYSKKKMEEPTVVSTVETEVSKPEPLVSKRALTEQKIEVGEGDLNKLPSVTSEEYRSQVINNIRDLRDFDLQYILDDERIKKLKDAELVSAVLQGDWRMLKGSELKVFNKNEMNEFADMAEKYQMKLDKLRTEHKDEPPVRLWHGSLRDTKLHETGFDDPQKRKGAGQIELGLKALSFTRDRAMNIDTMFGGKNPEKYVYTEMPKAEYEFKKIDMSPTQYNKKDLNVIANTLNGSDKVIRPLSLPRSYYNETENTIIEGDKFLPGASKEAGEKIYSGREKQEALIDKNLDLKALERDTLATIDLLRGYSVGATPQQKDRIARGLYTKVKDLLNNYLNQAGGEDIKGLGQSYASNLQSLTQLELSGGTGIDELLVKLRNYFDKKGNQEKAFNLNELHKALKMIEQKPLSSTDIGVKKQIEGVNKIRELTRKFKKGGLASKV